MLNLRSWYQGLLYLLTVILHRNRSALGDEMYGCMQRICQAGSTTRRKRFNKLKSPNEDPRALSINYKYTRNRAALSFSKQLKDEKDEISRGYLNRRGGQSFL
jgi:hypothetical protein